MILRTSPKYDAWNFYDLKPNYPPEEENKQEKEELANKNGEEV